jgi:hypothetical protein
MKHKSKPPLAREARMSPPSGKRKPAPTPVKKGAPKGKMRRGDQ